MYSVCMYVWCVYVHLCMCIFLHTCKYVNNENKEHTQNINPLQHDRTDESVVQKPHSYTMYPVIMYHPVIMYMYIYIYIHVYVCKYVYMHTCANTTYIHVLFPAY